MLLRGGAVVLDFLISVGATQQSQPSDDLTIRVELSTAFFATAGSCPQY